MAEMAETLSAAGASAAEAQVDALIRRVGARVRAARTETGMSRRELSERSGVSPRYLAQLEGGAGNISIGLLQRVALALGTAVEALVSAERPDQGEEAQVVALYRRSDARTQERVREILNPARQRLDRAERICLIGLRGAGKSTLGALVAADLGLPFIELNREIEAGAGMPIGEIIALYGEEGYRQLEAGTLQRIAEGEHSVMLAVAGGIVAQPQTFDTVLARFHTIWIKAAPEEHMARVRAQGDLRPMEGNPQAMAQLRQILTSREALYTQAPHHLDTSGKSVETARAELRALLLETGAGGPGRAGHS